MRNAAATNAYHAKAIRVTRTTAAVRIVTDAVAGSVAAITPDQNIAAFGLVRSLRRPVIRGRPAALGDDSPSATDSRRRRRAERRILKAKKMRKMAPTARKAGTSHGATEIRLASTVFAAVAQIAVPIATPTATRTPAPTEWRPAKYMVLMKFGPGEATTSVHVASRGAIWRSALVILVSMSCLGGGTTVSDWTRHTIARGRRFERCRSMVCRGQTRSRDIASSPAGWAPEQRGAGGDGQPEPVPVSAASPAAPGRGHHPGVPGAYRSVGCGAWARSQGFHHIEP